MARLVTLVALVALTGCLQTSMMPARQLNSGEVVASGGLNIPQAYWVPGATGQVTVGLGKGDLTANVSGSYGVLAGGLGGRYYLSEALTAEMQLRAGGVLDTRPVLATAGLQNVPTDAHPFYFGGHIGVLNGQAITFNRKPGPRTTRPLVGGTIGIGHIELGAQWRMQVELDVTVPPTAPFMEEGAPLPPNRISIGIFRLFE